MAYDPSDFKWLGDDNYVKTPRKLIYDTRLTDRQRNLWQILADRGGDTPRIAWPGEKWLARKLGTDDKGQTVTRGMVVRDLDALRKSGWLEIIPWIGDDGQQTTNCYVMWPARAAHVTEAEIRELRKDGGGYRADYRAVHGENFAMAS